MLLLSYLGNRLENCAFGWRMLLTEKFGHIFIECELCQVLCTKAELQRLHLHFFHPYVQRLFKLLKAGKAREHEQQRTRGTAGDY